MNKLKNIFKQLKKCPYLIAIAVSTLIITVYGMLLKFGAIKPFFSEETMAATDIPVATAIHNIKTFFSPEEIYEPVKFVPPDETLSADTSSENSVAKADTAEEQKEDKDEDADKDEADQDEDKDDEDEDKDDEEDEDGFYEDEEGCFSHYGKFREVGDEYFDDGAVFIGDSRTKGFVLYSGLEHLTNYAEVSYAVYSVFNKPVFKTPMGSFTLDQLMAAEPDKFTKIYIKFGLNEMSWGNEEAFGEAYYNLIDMLKYYQPNAAIYVQSILPVTKSKASASKAYDNDRIAVRNDTLKQVAMNEHVCYLNVASVFADEDGYLPSEYAADGIHLKAPYIAIWKDFLEKHAVFRKEWEDRKVEEEQDEEKEDQELQEENEDNEDNEDQNSEDHDENEDHDEDDDDDDNDDDDGDE